MQKQFYTLITSIVLVFCTNLAISQAYNPYQHAYQGWDGGKIKKSSPIRAFLNKFSLNVSLGYGKTYYNHIVDYDVLETPDKLIALEDYTLSNDTINYTGVIDWLNAPSVVSGYKLVDQDYGNTILNSDSSEIRYHGSGYNIPLSVSLHVDIDRFRIGGGIIYEYHRLEKLVPSNQGTYPYVPNFNSTFMFRYFFTIGGKVYHFLGWDYYMDIQIGKVKYGSQYDKSSLQNGIYFNLGIPIEYEFSEYFWIFLKPSFDFKNYTITIPQNDGVSSISNFQHNQPAFYFNFGVRMKLPEVKRCPVKSCRTQLKHVHGGHEFRGQPFYKKQNPKIGELYPKLEQNKRKNNRRNKGRN